MPSHIALLRGVNVGGVKLAMADLRQIFSTLGHTDVATYIQSGNVVFTPHEAESDGQPAGPDALAQAIQQGIAGALGIRPGVVVLTAGELAGVVAANPYRGELNPRRLHAVFLPAEPGPRERAEVAALAERAAARGGRDEASLIGRTLYLRTPDGFGRSELASLLLSRRSSPAAAGTARNWATVTKLLELCGS